MVQVAELALASRFVEQHECESFCGGCAHFFSFFLSDQIPWCVFCISLYYMFVVPGQPLEYYDFCAITLAYYLHIFSKNLLVTFQPFWQLHVR